MALTNTEWHDWCKAQAPPLAGHAANDFANYRRRRSVCRRSGSGPTRRIRCADTETTIRLMRRSMRQHWGEQNE